MATYDRLASLDLHIDAYALEGLELQLSPQFTRKTTVIRLQGRGEEGVGEDVTYDPEAHDAVQAAGPTLPLAGNWTLASFGEHLEALDLWPAPATMPAFRDYRVWAYESAALDLALRQAGAPLHEALGREPRPVTFVVSMGLGDPPSLEPVRAHLARAPSVRFKLDPSSSWDEELIAELVATGAVDTLDLKGLYKGTPVDQDADPVLYRRVAEAFPAAWIEDPELTPETDEVLRPHRDRITWDANIHGIQDIQALPFRPRTVNIKPSRFGSLRSLLETYDWCDAEGIAMYGGGQSELGPGRGQIQLLASLFHPDTPNDVAPGDYNRPEPPPGLTTSPLDPRPARAGFRRAGD